MGLLTRRGRWRSLLAAAVGPGDGREKQSKGEENEDDGTHVCDSCASDHVVPHPARPCTLLAKLSPDGVTVQGDHVRLHAS